MVRLQKLMLFLPRECATLCISAVIAVVRCPSVRLSITFVHCIQTAEDIVKNISRPGSPMILVFDPKRRYSISRGTPSTGAQITRGGINLRFSTEIAVYRKRYKIGP